jgi:hypothetical protein
MAKQTQLLEGWHHLKKESQPGYQKLHRRQNPAAAARLVSRLMQIVTFSLAFKFGDLKPEDVRQFLQHLVFMRYATGRKSIEVDKQNLLLLKV